MHGHYHLYVLLHHLRKYCSWSIRDTHFIVSAADHLCSLVFLVAVDKQSQALQVAFCSSQMGRNVTLPVPSQRIMVHLAHQLKENDGSLLFHADSLATQFSHITLPVLLYKHQAWKQCYQRMYTATFLVLIIFRVQNLKLNPIPKQHFIMQDNPTCVIPILPWKAAWCRMDHPLLSVTQTSCRNLRRRLLCQVKPCQIHT